MFKGGLGGAVVPSGIIKKCFRGDNILNGQKYKILCLILFYGWGASKIIFIFLITNVYTNVQYV